MDNKCKIKPNFDPSKDSVELPGKIQEVSTFDEALKMISDSGLSNHHRYAVDVDSSADPQSYDDAAKFIIGQYLEKLANTEFKDKQVDFKEGSVNSRRMKQALNLLLRAKNPELRDEEVDIMQVINPEDSEEDLKARSLDTTLSRYFKPYTKALFKDMLREKLAAITRIDLENERIITTVPELNESIEDFLKENFKTLVNYLEYIGTAKEWGRDKNFSSNLFPNGHTILSSYGDYLTKFEYFLEFKRKIGTLQEDIEKGYNFYLFGEGEDAKFLDALFAFLTIKYFDSILEDAVGQYVTFSKENKERKAPIWKEDNILHYKYYFGKDTEGRVKGWGIEARDALKELGNYPKFLIQLIGVIEPESQKVQGKEKLRTVDYFQTMTQILRFIPKFRQFLIEANNNKNTDAVSLKNRRVATSLYNSIVGLYEDPVENMKNIMSLFHEAIMSQYGKLGKKGQSKLMSVLDSIFNSYELKVLDSIYYSVFNPNNPKSFYSIEMDFNATHGINRGYPIVETLVAQVLDSAQKNYGEVVWNNTDKIYRTQIKPKFNVDKMKFELIEAMNIENLTNINESPYKLISAEKITRDPADKDSFDAEIYTVEIGDTTFKFTVPTTGRNLYGLITKNLKDVKISVIQDNKELDLTEQVGNIPTSLYKERKAVLESNTGANKILLNALKFIDFYTGTSFSAGEDGLHKYYLLSKYEKNGLVDMLSTALKGFYINKLNNDFIEAVNQGKYNSMAFQDYVIDNNLILAKIDSLDRKGNKWKSIWSMTSRGANLVTASTNTQWVGTYSRVLQILSGEIARSNIKNVENNSMPNYGLTFEGSNPWVLMESSSYKNGLTSDNQRKWTALEDNPFTHHPEAILDTMVDTDVSLSDGQHMMVKGMTDSELYYHGIVDKFFIPFLEDKIWIQPTAYADKTTFVNYLVSLNLDKDTNLATMPIYKIEDLIIQSVGGFYSSILNKVLNDYTIVFPELLSGITDIKEKVNAIEDIIRDMSEFELSSKFSALGLKLETDTHFRSISGKKLAFNELLLHYATELYTNEGFHKRMKIERKTFVRNLMESLTTFTVSGTGNPISKAYDKELGLGDDSWIEDGKLILAKNGNDVIHNLDELKAAENITVNPLLDRYLVVHSYLGNNLRYILSGNELNHKNKTLSSMNLGKKLLNKLVEQGILNEEDTFKQLLERFPDLRQSILNRLARIKTTAAPEELTDKDIEKFWNSMSFLDFKNLKEEIENSTSTEEFVKALPKLMEDITKDSLYEVEAFGQGAQLKRNVIIPGTMRPYTQNVIRGIPSTFRVAVVMDTPAETFNVAGEVKTNNDAHDGSAWICPITSILENWSMQDNEVGTVKKPIWHDYNGSLGTAVLVKFAAHTITNNIMRQAKGGINMLNIFKKMTNKSWEGLFKEKEINGEKLPLNIFDKGAYLPSSNIDIPVITNGNSLYYRGKRGIVYAINNVGQDVFANDDGTNYGVYYTIESEYDERTGTEKTPVKVYHYFDAEGNHIKSLTLLNDPTYHQMHSIYELYQLFGGLNSVALVNNQFENSEASLYATAMTINLVSEKTDLTLQEEDTFKQALKDYYQKKTEGKKVEKPHYITPQDLKHYNQPLKTLMVDYIINNSAIKNGAGNRNANERLYNNEDFDTFTLNTKYYGIQMDADHEADEAEMTEFSQVISALDAGGRLHESIYSIYTALGDMAIRESQDEYDIIGKFLEALLINEEDSFIKEFKETLGITSRVADIFEKAYSMDKEDAISYLNETLKEVTNKDAIAPAFETAVAKWGNIVANARDKVYTIIGSNIIDNMSTSRGQAGLAEAILREIKSKFNLKSSHKLDTEIKIPFSDPNIYSSVLSTFASLITKKSIRRPYPGIGGVLSPGYDIMMLYDLDGKTYQYQDILKEATEHYKTFISINPETGETIINAPKNYSSLADILDDEKWNSELVRIYLEEKRDAYNADKYYYSIPQVSNELPDFNYYTETFMPTDRIGIHYIKSDKTVAWYDMDLDSIRTYYDFKKDPRTFLLAKLFEQGIIKEGEGITVIGFRKNIDKARNLAPTKLWWTYNEKMSDGTVRLRTKNIYDTDEVRASFLEKDNSKVLKVLDEIATGTWKGYEITVFNEPAELIMSNIYSSRFNIGANVSLVDALNNKGHIFKDRPIRQTTRGVDRDFYDFVMLRDNGRHSYISFDRGFINAEEGEIYKQLHWGKKQRKPQTSGNVINDVYILDKSSRPLFMIGKDIRRDDIVYIKSENHYYLEKDGKRELIDGKNLSYDGEAVYEYVEFVTLHNYRAANVNHLVYNINTDKLKHALTVDGKLDTEQYYKQLLDIILGIYQADSYECLALNDTLYSIANSYLIKNLMSTLPERFKYDALLYKYLSRLNEEVISKNMITPTRDRTSNKWKFDLKSDNRLGLVRDGDVVKTGKAYYAKRVSDITKEYYIYLAKRKQTSFLRSLRYTASRIPAQTLQSFMQMKLAGYTGEEGNYTYVSHWQTWLQGSDYDIDKAYIMGLAFDDNGSYVGWSTLFDYYDIDTLYESEKLPMPKRNTTLIQNDNSDIDINDELSKILEINTKLRKGETANEKTDRLERLKLYQLIFAKLGENTVIKTVKDSNKEAFLELESHFNTKYPPGAQSQILRNFISSHILSTIQNVRNLKDSYVPVDMDDLRDAADASPKGLDAKTITLLNPLSIYKMQRLNMVGKNVIGIAATGQKASFMLSFYMHEAYKKAKEGIDYNIVTNEDGTTSMEIIPGSRLARAQFTFKSKRLVNNADNTITTIPDLNFEGVLNELREYAKTHKLNPTKPVDIMISLLISAATDNAKELILDKINAGDNLAKCFLFGIVMGIDTKTLVEFMTSPVISWVNSLSSRNLFMKRENQIDMCVSDVRKYLNKYKASLKDKNKSKPNDDLNMIVPTNLDETTINQYLQDLDEFENLLEAADEFSSLGRNLSINQGIKTRAEDLEIKANNIRKIIQDREKKLEIISVRTEEFVASKFNDIVGEDLYERYAPVISINFDPVRWLQDLNITLSDGTTIRYRELAAEYYDKIKKVFNVFDIINNLPHFDKMFSLMGTVFSVYTFPARTRIVQEAIKQYKELNPSRNLDSAGYSQIIGAANDLMLMKYFENRNILFPVLKGQPMIKPDGTIYSATSNNNLDLSTEDGRANFKFIFENYIVPKMKNGTLFNLDYFKKVNSESNPEKIEALELLCAEYNDLIASNDFVISLMKGRDNDIPIWKTDVNMSSDTPYTLLKIAKFGKGLQQLHSIKLGNYSIADWFAIYNFIVNKNQYGSDRLTKAFEVFLNTFNGKKESVISDYLEFIGLIDYDKQDILNIFDINIYDMLMQSARVVDSYENSKALMVIKDMKYYIKTGSKPGAYTEFGDVAETNNSYTLQEQINKYMIRKSYYTLSKPFTEFVDRILSILDHNSAYKGFTYLMQRGNLIINLEC